MLKPCYTFSHFQLAIYLKGSTMAQNCRSYGCLGFLGDVFMTLITGGLWLIWIFVREMRNH